MSLLRSSKDVSRKLFEKYSSFYNKSKFINNHLNGWDNELLMLNPVEPILDLGCGTGRTVKFLIQNGLNRIFGSDQTLSGLKIAQKQLKLSSSYLIQSPAENLPFKDSLFQTVIMLGVIHYLEEPIKVLNEVKRVLKPSGLLFIVDPYYPWGIRQLINLVLNIYPIMGTRYFYSHDNLITILTKSGFIPIILNKRQLYFVMKFEKTSS